MADKQSTTGADVESSVGRDPTTSITVGDPTATEKPRATHKDAAGLSLEVESGEGRVKEGLDDGARTDAEGGDGEAAGDAGGDPPGDEDGGQSADAEAEDLGDFNPEDPEVVGKFEAAYAREDGSLNVDRLSEEWWANAGKEAATDGSLNEGTYAFLEHAYGIKQADMKAIEAGQKALQQQLASSLHERAGGKDVLDAAVTWAKDGGYTEAQRERFNTVMASGDQEAIHDAIDALVARHAREGGGGGGGSGGRNRPPRLQGQQRRPSTPERNVTQEAPRQREAGFKDRQEYRAALREAQQAKDPVKLAAVRRKLRASDFWRGGE